VAGILPTLQSGIKQHESEGSARHGQDDGGNDGHLYNIRKSFDENCFHVTKGNKQKIIEIKKNNASVISSLSKKKLGRFSFF
jgi:hypothetical protein